VGCTPIEQAQANNLPQFHDCRHHPVSFCNEESQVVLPADTGCELGSASALALGAVNETFLRLICFRSVLALTLRDEDESGLRVTCSGSGSALALGVDNGSVMSSTFSSDTTDGFSSNVLSSSLERSPSNVLS
jgi:hypothetical protein